MYREDVVWRADTGAYHPRASGSPVLMPPMLGVEPAPAPAHPSAPGACSLAWLGTREATNLLLLLIVVILILGREA